MLLQTLVRFFFQNFCSAYIKEKKISQTGNSKKSGKFNKENAIN